MSESPTAEQSCTPENRSFAELPLHKTVGNIGFKCPLKKITFAGQKFSFQAFDLLSRRVHNHLPLFHLPFHPRASQCFAEEDYK